MTRKTANKFARDVHGRAVRMTLEHENDHDCRWADIAAWLKAPSLRRTQCG